MMYGKMDGMIETRRTGTMMAIMLCDDDARRESQ